MQVANYGCHPQLATCNSLMEIYEQINVGDVVEMRKQHPCGGVQWQVDRTGADIGMVCLTCKRRVLIPRRKFAHQVKRFLQRGPQP